MKKGADLSGRIFSRLTVMYSPTPGAWKCRCECGNEVNVERGNLLTGNSRSCGCYKRDNPGGLKHGYSTDRVSEMGRRAYEIYRGMLARCNAPTTARYERYGGRGIRVCSRWSGEGGFLNFISDMGEPPSREHSIGRKKNDGNYTPKNCRWETRMEQMANKGNSRIITIDGVSKHMAEWTRIAGISPMGMFNRLRRGWAGARLLQPPRGK